MQTAYLRQARGFSMLEIILAIALIAIAVLVLMGLATTALSARQKSLDTEAARQVAQAQLQRVIRSALNDSPSGSRRRLFGHNSEAPLESGSSTTGVTEFSYSVFAKSLTVGAAPNRLAQVRVEVWWWGDKDQSRAGMGRLRYEISQLVDEPSAEP